MELDIILNTLCYFIFNITCIYTYGGPSGRLELWTLKKQPSINIVLNKKMNKNKCCLLIN